MSRQLESMRSACGAQSHKYQAANRRLRRYHYHHCQVAPGQKTSQGREEVQKALRPSETDAGLPAPAVSGVAFATAWSEDIHSGRKEATSKTGSLGQKSTEILHLLQAGDSEFDEPSKMTKRS